MGYLYLLKVFLTLFVAFFGSNWLFSTLYINTKRDFTSVAHNQQANIASVRKEKETAHYRNFLVPLGFPLITGLSLSLKYKIRNGNFADVWKAIIELSNEKSIRLSDSKEYNLGQINGMALHILERHLQRGFNHVGIAVAPSSLPGFVLSIASMIGSIQSTLTPHFLASIPRQRIEDIDVLVIDSWSSYKMLNGSERWYKLVIVCESVEEKRKIPDNVITWSDVLDGYSEVKVFDYAPPEDNSDDSKVLAYTTSAWNATTSYTQGCLVSGIASFIQGLPSGHELSCSDSLTIVEGLGEANLSIHFWHKALAVLLHGGTVSFLSKSSLNVPNLKGTTLLFCETEDLKRLLDDMNSKKSSLLQRIRFAWASALFSEGVFTTLGQSRFESLNDLRCVFLSERIENTQLVASFPNTVPKRQPSAGIMSRNLSTEELNRIRVQLGCRIVVELYCPDVVMGPLFQTNFYDYRVLPSSVDANFIFCGAISTNLEGKIVETDENPDLDIEKRQGMLCIRGFTIGRPAEANRLKSAMALSDKFGGGEGWMPMVGIFGLWGKDGCLYIYK